MKSVLPTVRSCTPFLFALFTFAQPLAAQKKENLVRNPSFELVAAGKSIALKNAIDVAADWNAPNQGESLLYTTEGDHVYDPNGSSWPFKARTGRNVAGMNVFGENGSHPRREYIQGTLKQPLEVGKKYYFEFWVHYHCEGANNIGIAFLPEKISIAAPGRLNLQPVSYQAMVTPYNNDVNTWTLVRDSFVAAKPYQSFIIGNFFPNTETRVENRRYGHYFAYVDDIWVAEAPDQPAVLPVITEAEQKKWEYNTTVIKDVAAITKGNAPVAVPEPEIVVPPAPAVPLKPVSISPVLFGAGSAELSAETTATLDAVAARMQQNPALRLDINGFASNEGSTATNLHLSRQRARQTETYLVNKGVAPDRITVRALGEDQPVAPNDSEENRRQNRRVEFRWSE